MRVAVTGASGLMGRHLAAELVAHGHSVVCIDRVPAEGLPGRFAAVDLIEIGRLEQAIEGADAVAHLARVPFPYASSGYDAATRIWHKPDGVGDAALFNLNVGMTYNVFAAGRAVGARKMVIGSSFAVYGLYYPSRQLSPDYLPVDETHPRRPDDAYGLTKLIGEDLADAYAAAFSMQIASLRFPGVSREDPETVTARQANPMSRGIGGLWTYIDARDAALACRLALEVDFEGHEAFNICAPTTFMNVATDELAARYMAGVPCTRRSAEENWAGYDPSKAERMLGFKAQYLFKF